LPRANGDDVLMSSINKRLAMGETVTPPFLMARWSACGRC